MYNRITIESFISMYSGIARLNPYETVAKVTNKMPIPNQHGPVKVGCVS